MKGDLGSKLFRNSAIGGAAGTVGGGIFGAIKANRKIKALPKDTVTLRAHDKPVYDTIVVGDEYAPIYMTDTDGNVSTIPNWDDVDAKFPMRNEDGALQMEHVPAKTISDHGRAIVSEVTHNIKEPSNIPSYEEFQQMKADGKSYDYEYIKYKKVGQWKEPVVKFETGISRAAHVFGYAAAGMALGAAGGALITLALDKA